MDPLLDCPKCRAMMMHRIAEPRPGAKTIRADICPNCASLWFDDYELVEVSDALGGLPFRRQAIRDVSTPSKNLSACPRCQKTGHEGPIEFTLYDVSIDFCMTCHGVWLDGGEYEALARASTESEQDKENASYRSAPQAARTISSGMFECPSCGKEYKTSESCIVPAGLVCGTCFYADEEAELAKEKNYGGMRETIMKNRFVGSAAPTSGDERLPSGSSYDGWERPPYESSGASVASRVVFGVLGAVLSGAFGQGIHCSQCGNPRGGPSCPH